MNSLPLYCWAAEDTPATRAEEFGVKSLSNSELISIIIGSGVKDCNAVEIARNVLNKCDNDLSKISKSDELQNIKGLGKQKLLRILAAIELGNRKQAQGYNNQNPVLDNALYIHRYMQPKMEGLNVEEFWIIMMNTKYRVIKSKRVHIGGISMCMVDIRCIIKECVLNNTSVLIACHNHPSGNTSPSKYDDDLTIKIQKACDVMQIKFADHVVITDNDYYSYQENGRI